VSGAGVVVGVVGVVMGPEAEKQACRGALRALRRPITAAGFRVRFGRRRPNLPRNSKKELRARMEGREPWQFGRMRLSIGGDSSLHVRDDAQGARLLYGLPWRGAAGSASGSHSVAGWYAVAKCPRNQVATTRDIPGHATPVERFVAMPGSLNPRTSARAGTRAEWCTLDHALLVHDAPTESIVPRRAHGASNRPHRRHAFVQVCAKLRYLNPAVGSAVFGRTGRGIRRPYPAAEAREARPCTVFRRMDNAPRKPTCSLQRAHRAHTPAFRCSPPRTRSHPPSPPAAPPPPTPLP